MMASSSSLHCILITIPGVDVLIPVVTIIDEYMATYNELIIFTATGGSFAIDERSLLKSPNSGWVDRGQLQPSYDRIKIIRVASNRDILSVAYENNQEIVQVKGVAIRKTYPRSTHGWYAPLQGDVGTLMYTCAYSVYKIDISDVNLPSWERLPSLPTYFVSARYILDPCTSKLYIFRVGDITPDTPMILSLAPGNARWRPNPTVTMSGLANSYVMIPKWRGVLLLVVVMEEVFDVFYSFVTAQLTPRHSSRLLYSTNLVLVGTALVALTSGIRSDENTIHTLDISNIDSYEAATSGGHLEWSAPIMKPPDYQYGVSFHY